MEQSPLNNNQVSNSKYTPTPTPSQNITVENKSNKSFKIILIIFFIILTLTTILGGIYLVQINTKNGEKNTAQTTSQNDTVDDQLDPSTTATSSVFPTTNPTSSSPTATLSPTVSGTSPIPTKLSTTNPTATQTPAPTPQTISLSVSIRDGSFSMSTISLKKGNTYKITITNTGNDDHSLTSSLLDTGKLSPGQSKTITITPGSIGTFKFNCNVPCPPFHNDMQNGYNFSVT